MQSCHWATPIVVVYKPDCRVCNCGDYQATKNPHIPSSVTAGLDIDETLAKLAGYKVFSKIDVRDAYLHVPLDAKSQLLTVFSTPFGFYKYKFLPFGAKSAPHIFQTRVRKIMANLEGTHCDLDYILVWTSLDMPINELFAGLYFYLGMITRWLVVVPSC